MTQPVGMLTIFYAPTVNAYKRYRAGSWAPTRLGRSLDNRTASFRVVGAGPSLRIECRIPGAATDAFEQSEFAKEVFGSQVVEHYTHFFRTEQRAFDRAVTDWERRRYFERI